MPEASSGRVAPRGVVRSRWLQRLALSVALGSLVLSVPSVSFAAGTVRLSTPYPAVAVAPGEKVSFDLSVRTDVADRVDLAVDQVPDGWIATLRGEGFVVDSVQTSGTDPVALTLDVTVPEDAAAGVGRVVVAAESGPASAQLALDIRVEETAAGQVTLTSDFPELQGSSDQAFTFSMRLSNDTAEDLTFSLQATGPAGWQVEARPSGQTQAASATVQAGGSTTINVTADAPEGTEAGSFPIVVQAVSPERTVEGELVAAVIGDFSMTLTTPDGIVNTRGNAGGAIEETITIQNSGTAALENVALSATPPTGWDVTFEPESVTVPANDDGTVVARIVPSGDAIAGDYVVRFRASTDQANDEFELRVTIETSLLWGIVGIGLIALVVIGLGWVFRRYGRR